MNKEEIKGLIIPFLIGGSIITGVKYASKHIKNPAVAAIIGGIPTGLLSIYFLEESKRLSYSHNYFFITISLLIAIAVFYLLSKYSKLSKHAIHVIAISTWAILVGTRYTIAGKK